MHYANTENPQCCLIHVYKLYQTKYPDEHPDGALYFKPLVKPSEDVQYTKQAVGHNTLSSTISLLCKNVGIKGFFTNHSLCTSAAARHYDAGVDEQRIMLQTGCRSTAGLRSYKRTSNALKQYTSQVLNDCSNRNTFASYKRWYRKAASTSRSQ